MNKKIVLVGGGHSHMHVLAKWKKAPIAGYELILISEFENQLYSGMLPGFLAGWYTLNQCQFHLPTICRAYGVKFIKTRAIGLDLKNKKVVTELGESSFDIASINVGSLPAPRGRATHFKPLSGFMNRWSEVKTKTNATIGVVGGGASGVEIGFMMANLLKSNGTKVKIYERSDRLMRGFPPAAGDIAEEVAKKIGVEVVKNVGLAPEELTDEYLFLATQPEAPKWLSSTGLDLNESGFINVESTLLAKGQDCIFAAGDSVNFVAKPHAKSGVYAVRHGEILMENIWRLAQSPNKELKVYSPQSDFLSLVTLGSKETLFIKGRIVLRGKFFWYLKDWIDRSFMDRFADAAS